jgi:predicted nicotinamide N-methyase
MTSILEYKVPGGWTTRRIEVEHQAFELVLPTSPDELLNELTADADQPGEIIDPYWGAIWPAAIPTASAILRSKWPGGTKTLEIGTGIGLVGIAALARGLRVTLSDYIPWSVELALENARRNGFSDATGLVLDWRRPTEEQFPIILASDVLYDANKHDCLLALVHKMLTRDGVCWIGDPGRYHFADFVRKAVQRGFHVRLRNLQGKEFSQPKSGEFQIVVLSREA